MRNKTKIAKIIKLLKKLWLAHNRQRLGQLLENTFGCNGCIFHKEDDEIETELKMLLGEK